MSVTRKSPRVAAAYDPIARPTARLWALVTYLAVFAVVAGVVVFAVRYQPLSAGNLASDRASESGPMLVVRYQEGTTFSVGFLLVNDGPLPLEVRAIQLSGRNELMTPVKVETAPGRYAGRLGATDPSLEKFRAFTLGGGDRRWIVVRTAFGNCDDFAYGAFEIFTRFQVTYTALGLTKHVWVPLPKGVRVDSPPDVACPARAG
jgi:hypothetical protein